MVCRTLRPPAGPLLGLPAAQEILRLDSRARGALRRVLLELRLRSREDGDRAWRKRKGPMATYRHDIARHAGLLARALRRTGEGAASARGPDGAVADADAHKPRSSRASVRNPLLRLAGTAALQRFPAPARGTLRALLRDLARACADLADRCWSRRERSDALYWRTAAVYAGHLARALACAADEQCELPLAEPSRPALPPDPAMRREAITFRVEYKMFEPGERIRPTSSRCPLDPGEYVVTRCIAPISPGDDSTVFVEGHRWGVGTEYLESVDRENPRQKPHPTEAILAFADMHAAATEGWERIAAAVSEADLDSDGVISRLLAFIEAHGLGEDLTDYLAAQHALQARDEDEVA